jgi:putative peptidoglycan lipid II flippase
MKLNLALGTLAGANLVLSLVIQWYVVTRLGVGAATDALFAGMAVPQLVLAVVSGSLMHVLVPLLSGEGAGAFGETA